jgi:hypothetical protein
MLSSALGAGAEGGTKAGAGASAGVLTTTGATGVAAAGAEANGFWYSVSVFRT